MDCNALKTVLLERADNHVTDRLVPSLDQPRFRVTRPQQPDAACVLADREYFSEHLSVHVRVPRPA
jgi:hypothetical protein